MSRLLTVLIAIIIFLIVFLTARYFKDLYTASPYTYEGVAEPEEEPSSVEPSGRDFHNWREFIAPYGHFKVLIPSLPQHVTDSIIDPKTKEVTKYNTFVSGGDKGPVFMVSVITFSQIEKESDEEVLKNVVADMLERNKENHLKSMSLGNFRQFKSLDFSLTNGNAAIAGKVLLDGDTVYVLSMVDKSEDFDAKKLEFFIKSFDLADATTTSQPTSPLPAASASHPTTPSINK